MTEPNYAPVESIDWKATAEMWLERAATAAAERDALRTIIDEAQEALEHDGVGQAWRLRRILSRATTTEKGTD